MVHLGDITKIKGCNAPVVDCIIGGSPCQDLSVAGKRAGLSGERSGLYMEQIRIIKEMRHKDELRGRTGESIRPRYMVWENVPGAFSSNQGKDFAAVLEEAIRIAEPEAPNVPVPEKGWPTAGCLMGNSWSVAWRVLDAQFWGVPQRRRRIALVADFGGQSAPEILFIRKSVSRDLDESEQERKATARDAKNRSGAADRDGIGLDIYNYAITGEIAATLTAATGQGAAKTGPSVAVPASYTPIISFRTGNSAESRTIGAAVGKTPTVRPVHAPAVAYGINGDIAGTMDASYYKGCGMRQGVEREVIFQPVVYSRQRSDELVENSVVSTQSCRQYKDATDLVVECAGLIRYIVRRLTPLECERLQGFPDHWTDIGEWIDSKGKKHKDADSPRYKALGNSIAIPPWKWVLKRICACYERDATMASLFDGIGGFPYIWEQLNGKGSCLWASEIEEFPMAVTKLRFSE